MSDEPRRREGLFRYWLSIAGGVLFVSFIMLAACVAFKDAPPLIGLAWIGLVIVMFRWFYRDE
jgi:hypothetical protein